MPHHPFLWSKWTSSFFFRSFDRVIAHSEKSRIQLEAMGVLSPILVVPHGVYDLFNLDRLMKHDAINALGGKLSTDNFTVLFFGALDERKGLPEFLNVARTWPNDNIQFLVAGSNQLSPEHRHLLEMDGAGSIRIDVGHVPFESVQNYFSAADVVVLPYREGTTSGVLKIAMAFGKPVIASDVGDMAETLNDWPGILISHHQIEVDLRLAIDKMHKEYEEYEALASVKNELYGWSSIAKKYAEFLV
jgi:glycosyltransferase involved in cell wall biosynthesis